MSQDTRDPDDAVLAAAVRTLNAARPPLLEHPSKDRLLDYSERSLTEEENESIREHLRCCPDCTELFLEFSAFSPIRREDDPEELSGRAIRRGWERLQESLDEERLKIVPALEPALGGEGPPTSVEPRRSPGMARRLFGSTRFAYALAAVFCLVAVGLSYRLVLEEGNVAGPGGPAGSRVGLSALDLVVLNPRPPRPRGPRGDDPDPGAARLRSPEESSFIQHVTVSQGPMGIILTSLPDGEPPSTKYRVEIVKLQESKSTLLSSLSLAKDAEGTFTIQVPEGLLEAGFYEIRVIGTSGEVKNTYTLQVDAASGNDRE